MNSKLELFCTDDPTCCYDLRTPWQHDNYWYASDGIICGRAKIGASDDILDNAGRLVPNVHALFASPFSGKKTPLPPYTKATQSLLCDECEGRGTKICKECGSTIPCSFCGGRKRHIIICERLIKGSYYKLLSSLGKVIVYDDGKGCKSLLAFRAGNVEGLLMPMVIDKRPKEIQ